MSMLPGPGDFRQTQSAYACCDCCDLEYRSDDLEWDAKFKGHICERCQTEIEADRKEREE